MAISDPIADMLVRLHNGVIARHETVLVPASQIKIAVARILKGEGFIRDYEVVRGKGQRLIKVHLAYGQKKEPLLTGARRISKPGLRVYMKHSEVPRVYGGRGISILSTPQGVMTGHEAWQKKVGGEVLCYVW